jgi:tetratricopeptide (TPR) repeat protein
MVPLEDDAAILPRGLYRLLGRTPPLGEATLGYHLQNIVLHALAAFLVLRILRRLEIPGAYLAAAIFALHPVQVESVAWMTELKNTLSGVCYLAAMLAYLRFDGTRSKAWYAAAATLFLFALLSKAVTATLPAALLLIYWWQRGRLRWKQDLLPLLPLFALALSGGVFSAWMEQREIGPVATEYAFNWGTRLLIVGRAAWFYIGKLCWPAQLMFIYPRWDINPAVWWQYLFPLLAAAALAALWWLRGRSRAPLAAALFFGGTLFPALGFFNVFPFRYSFVADHFQYLACLGIIVLASAAAKRLATGVRKTRRLLAIWPASLALLAVLGALTWRQSQIYADAETLYRVTLAGNAQCWLAQTNLGKLLLYSNRAQESIDYFRRALPFHHSQAEAHTNLGSALIRVGRIDEAIEQCRLALATDAEYPAAHYHLGLALAQLGRSAEAIEHYRLATKKGPDVALAHNNLGILLASSGRVDEALPHYEEALRLDANFFHAHYNFGNALLGSNRPAEALEQYRQALRLKPDLVDARIGVANALAVLQRFPDAIQQYEEVLRLRPDSALVHLNLGIALARAGRIAEAFAHRERAMRSAQAAGDRAMIELIESRLRVVSPSRP